MFEDPSEKSVTPSKTRRAMFSLLAALCGMGAFVTGVAGISYICIAAGEGYEIGKMIMGILLSVVTIALVVYTARFNWKSTATGEQQAVVSPPPTCDCCKRPAETRKVEIHGHMGAIAVWFHRSQKGFLCRDCITKAFWKFTPQTFLLGWWGLVSMVVTPICLVNNLLIYIRSRKLAKPEAEESALERAATIADAVS